MNAQLFTNIFSRYLIVIILLTTFCEEVFSQRITNLENTPLLYEEGEGAVRVTTNLSINTNSSLSYATVTISQGYNIDEDTLIYRDETPLYSVFDDELGQLLLLNFPAGSTTESDVLQSALRSVFYQNDDDDPQNNQRIISFAVYSQSGDTSNVVSRRLEVQKVNNSPQLSSASNAPVVVNNLTSPVLLAQDLAVTDADDAIISSAVVRIGDVQFDQLVFTDNTNDNIQIQRAVGNNRRLILTGRDSKANYQAALRSIGVQNLFSFAQFKGNRTAAIQVTDANGATSNQFEQYIYVLNRNGANNIPPSTQNITVVTNENEAFNFEAQQFQEAYSDPEQNDLTTIRIRSLPKHGFLLLDGLEVDADFIVRDQGFIEREDLNKLTYVPNRGYTGLDEFDWSTTDGTTPSANTSNVFISVEEVQQPLAVEIAGRATVNEDQTTVLPPIQIQSSASIPLEVTLSVETGQISILPFILPYVNLMGEDSEDLRFSGTAQAVRLALSGLQYTPAPNIVGNDILEITARSPARQDDGVLVITIAPVDDPVILSNLENDTLDYIENGPALPITNNLELTDPDGAATVTSATVTIPEGLNEDEDQLSYSLTGGITAAINNNQLEFLGESSLRQYQSVLRTVAYQNFSDNPTSSLLTFEFQVTDEKDSVSNVVSRIVRVVPVDDSTLLSTSEPELLSYVLGSDMAPFHSSLSITDVDSDSLTQMTVFFDTGYDSEIDSLLVNVPPEMEVSWDDDLGRLQINGRNSIENYQTIARSLLYQSSSEEVLVSRKISIQVFNGEVPSNILSRTIQLIENEPPVVNSFGKKVVQNGALEFATADFLANYSDPDNSPVSGGYGSLRIVSLPSHGVLTLASDTITQNEIDQSLNGYFLSSQAITQLQYRPFNNYLGEDAWSWNAFDGAELADDSAQVTLNVLPALSTNVNNSVEICPGETIELSVEVTSGEAPFTYEWSCIEENCQIQTAVDEPVIAISPLVSTQYIVTVTSSEGLDSVQDTISVVAVDCSGVPLEIPSAFTPNDDGFNDFWVLPNAVIFSSVRVTVYDRFGNQVYDNANYQNDWDGTFNGEKLPAGSYYYSVVLPRELKDYSGTVTLLR